MKNEIDYEAISLEIITCAGEAKSYAMESIQAAKAGKIDEAYQLIAKAEEAFVGAHKSHFDVVQREAEGEKIQLTLLFVHSEDQLMTTSTIIDLSKHFIDLYKLLNK